MSQVYKVVIYLAPLQDEAQEFLFQNLKKWFPDHSPLVSVFGIEKLSLEGMRIEIEAWAHVPA
jgi:enamine deaminase RidA (YjgF/YER057c/UK114 family)